MATRAPKSGQNKDDSTPGKICLGQRADRTQQIVPIQQPQFSAKLVSPVDDNYINVLIDTRTKKIGDTVKTTQEELEAMNVKLKRVETTLSAKIDAAWRNAGNIIQHMQIPSSRNGTILLPNAPNAPFLENQFIDFQSTIHKEIDDIFANIKKESIPKIVNNEIADKLTTIITDTIPQIVDQELTRRTDKSTQGNMVLMTSADFINAERLQVKKLTNNYKHNLDVYGSNIFHDLESSKTRVQDDLEKYKTTIQNDIASQLNAFLNEETNKIVKELEKIKVDPKMLRLFASQFHNYYSHLAKYERIKHSLI